jgi:hypothetical protein
MDFGGAVEMKMNRVGRPVLILTVLIGASGVAGAQTKEEYVPQVGQPGKDVVWVPSPPETVEKMMEVGKITPQDYVVDLGSGDGRNVIAAAKRGARGMGFEYNKDLVEYSRRSAAKEGVGDRAQFTEGDMFQADFSKATVLALFLLPSNLDQLRDKILNLRPGTRVVLNTFGIAGWTPEETVTLDNCTSWCTVMLNIVPAKVGGNWKTPEGDLTLQQEYQMVTGTLVRPNGQKVDIKGRLRGEQITLAGLGQEFTGRVNGNSIEGTTSQQQKMTLTRVQ